MAWTLAGAALAAGGANGLNQWLEAARDVHMRHACGRPLPTRRIGLLHALLASGVAAAAGPGLLVLLVGVWPAILAAAAVSIYVGLYTPLKRISTFCTPAVARSSALPPMIGWSARPAAWPWAAWLLAAILFIWQIPHGLAFGWLYRQDYVRGGFRLLPVIDGDGHITGRMVVLYCAGLLPVSLSVWLAGMTGRVYAAGALVLGGVLLIEALRLRARTDAQARRLFLASIAYLPLLLALMLLDG